MKLEKAPVDETIYWITTSATPAVHTASSAHLLPAFDEYNVAYKNRQLIFDSAKTINWGALGPTVVIDGRIAGTWKATAEKNHLTIAVSASSPLNRREKLAIAAAAKQYAAFLMRVDPVVVHHQ